MDWQLNDTRPLIMHIDLNSCFAIIEQQANPLIRYKPVAIAAYDSPHGMIIASSYEAKSRGIKLGVTVEAAKLLDKNVIVMMPDPDKYFDAHRRFKKVLLNYTNAVVPKSIDEFVVDFTGSPAIRGGSSLVDVGLSIKQDIKAELGEYVTVNVGIGPNRFLAKLAAGLHKPDGLDVIDASNLRTVYSRLNLIDLPGINRRYQARLNLAGIYTPLQLLDAPVALLKKQVFKSIVGYYWYLRMRGHEVDAINYGRKSFGQQYALSNKTIDRRQLARLLMKLCEKAGRRMRGNGYSGHGVRLWLSFENHQSWSKGRQTRHCLYATQDIYLNANRLLNEAIITARVTNIGITVFKLITNQPVQLGLFDDSGLDQTALARAADTINNRYGEFTLVPAMMINMQDIILKRVAFGSIGDW